MNTVISGMQKYLSVWGTAPEEKWIDAEYKAIDYVRDVLNKFIQQQSTGFPTNASPEFSSLYDSTIIPAMKNASKALEGFRGALTKEVEALSMAKKKMLERHNTGTRATPVSNPQSPGVK